MTTQHDSKKRVVALSNLRAMCERISGTCHRFTVDAVTAHSVRVSYSNPDECGRDNPVTAVFPAYCDGAKDNPSVVLDAIRYVNSPGEEWQAFWALFDCPELFRTSSDSQEWRTRYEIMVQKYPQFAVTSEWSGGGSVQTWYAPDVDGSRYGFRSWSEAQDKAVSLMREFEEKQRNATSATA